MTSQPGTQPDDVDCAVIGAGVVGLAIARALALRGSEVVILEAGTHIGTGISSRNGEVVHAGIYYPPGSLKARLCVEGRRQVWEYCESHGIPHQRCGKLIPANSQAQVAAISKLATRAAQNGVSDLVWLEGGEVQRLEPELRCEAALLSPSSGTVDSHALMLALLGDAQAHGAMLAVGSRVVGARRLGPRLVLQVDTGTERTELAATTVVNAAGLDAVALAEVLMGPARAPQPTVLLAKGTYFSVAASAPFSRLIYPLATAGEDAVPLTRDLGGQPHAGPKTEWLQVAEPERIDYAVTAEGVEAIYSGVRRYWPGLPDGCLHPAYAGVWPRLSRTGPADFVIAGPSEHGVAGVVNLIGIESPGLTSALAIGDHVQRLLSCRA